MTVNSTHGSESDSTSVQSATSVLDGTRAGYVAMSVRTKTVTSPSGCPIAWYPIDGTGMTCRQRSDDKGAYWVKTYTDSYQGRTVLVRVILGSTEVILAQSQGFPSRDVFWDASTKDALPWDGRDALEPDKTRKIAHPQLHSMPLTTTQELGLARELASEM